MSHAPAQLAELRQIEARLDQRIDLIIKAESSLRGLFEALRQQVGIAHPVLADLKKIVPVLQKQTQVSQVLNDRVKTEESKQIHEMAQAFRGEVSQTLAQVRESMLDQIGRLKAQLRIETDPMIHQLGEAYQIADGKLAAVVQIHGESLQQRGRQLCEAVDEIAASLEERLMQRVMSMRRRVEDSVADIQTVVQNRIDHGLQQAEAQIRQGEQGLQDRVDSAHRVLDNLLAETDLQLRDRLETLENHAMRMQDDLEEKLTRRTDELILSLREKLQQEIEVVTGVSTRPAQRNARDNDAEPRLEASVFIKHPSAKAGAAGGQ